MPSLLSLWRRRRRLLLIVRKDSWKTSRVRSFCCCDELYELYSCNRTWKSVIRVSFLPVSYMHAWLDEGIVYKQGRRIRTATLVAEGNKKAKTNAGARKTQLGEHNKGLNYVDGGGTVVMRRRRWFRGKERKEIPIFIPDRTGEGSKHKTYIKIYYWDSLVQKRI